jgi:hypothetical protein
MMAGAAVAVPVFLAAFVALAGVVAVVVLGTTLRAIGRGFGKGIFGLVAACAGHADNPMVKTRLVARPVAKIVAKAVDRNAATRTERVTAFLGGESFSRSGLFD